MITENATAAELWKEIARTDWRRCPGCGLEWPHPSVTSGLFCPSCLKAGAIHADQGKVDFLFRWLALADKWEIQDGFFWRCEGKDIHIFVICNDLFYWGTADLEELTAENIDSYEQTYKDAETALQFGHCHADELWCCRVRKMRPQGACYKSIPKELWPLFDTCGPEREIDICNPRKQPTAGESNGRAG